MSYCDYHVVLCTRLRRGILDMYGLRGVLSSIDAQATAIGIIVHKLCGYADHIHLLISLKPGQDIFAAISMLKEFSLRENPDNIWHDDCSVFPMRQEQLPALCMHLEDHWIYHETKSVTEELDFLRSTFG